jgi:hypothetical protein
MFWVAAVLAVFLFCYFAERRHKVVFLEFCAFSTALIGALAGGYLL